MLELGREFTWGTGSHVYVVRPWGHDDDLICLEQVNSGHLLSTHSLMLYLAEATTYPGFRYTDE